MLHDDKSLLICYKRARPGSPHRPCPTAASEPDSTRRWCARSRYVYLEYARHVLVDVEDADRARLGIRRPQVHFREVYRAHGAAHIDVPTQEPPRARVERVQRERKVSAAGLGANRANNSLDNSVGDLHADRALGLLRGTAYSTLSNVGIQGTPLALSTRYAEPGAWAYRYAASLSRSGSPPAPSGSRGRCPWARSGTHRPRLREGGRS